MQLASVPSRPEIGGLGPAPDRLARWASLPYDILVRGEMGTGKTFLARRLHDVSPRAERPFVKCSLAALAVELAESELFGHALGAFTNAVRRRIGRIEEANGGTLFLDEVGDCPLSVQPKLLEALETKEIQRVGENRARRIDFRFVAATNADLEALVAAGRFRGDLLARFGYFLIELLPLRERRHEIARLLALFLERESKVVPRERPPHLSDAVLKALHGAPWPDNIRGLVNVCRYLVGNAGDIAELADLPPQFLRTLGVDPSTPEESERVRVKRVIAEEGGNKKRAARRLGISRSKLYRLLDGEKRGQADR